MLKESVGWPVVVAFDDFGTVSRLRKASPSMPHPSKAWPASQRTESWRTAAKWFERDDGSLSATTNKHGKHGKQP